MRGCKSKRTVDWCWEGRINEVVSKDVEGADCFCPDVTVLFAWHNREGAVQSADS